MPRAESDSAPSRLVAGAVEVGSRTSPDAVATAARSRPSNCRGTLFALLGASRTTTNQGPNGTPEAVADGHHPAVAGDGVKPRQAHNTLLSSQGTGASFEPLSRALRALHGRRTHPASLRGVYYLPLTLADGFRVVNPWLSIRTRRPSRAVVVQLSPDSEDFGSVYLGVHSCTPTCKPSAPWP